MIRNLDNNKSAQKNNSNYRDEIFSKYGKQDEYEQFKRDKICRTNNRKKYTITGSDQ